MHSIKFFYMHREIILILLVILMALSIRGALLLNTEDFHGISNGRVLQAMDLLNRGPFKNNFDPVHPPVHIALLVAGLKIIDSPVIVPRIISLVFAIALFFPFYLYTREAFDKRTAFFSIVALAFYSEHIVYSIIGTSETVFHFFLFLAFALLILFKEKHNRLCLRILALSLGIASLCRYEGLIFIPLFAFFIRKNKNDLLIFLIISLLPSIIWMGLNYYYYANPFRFIDANNFSVPLQYDWIRSQGVRINFWSKLLFWPKSLIDTLGLPVFILGISGIIHCVYKKINMPGAMMFLVLFCVFIIEALQERLYMQPRYSITLGLMLLPFAFFFCFKLIELISRKGRKIPAIVALLLVAYMLPAINNRLIAEPLSAPFFAKDIAGYLNKNVKRGENVFIDHCGDEKYREPIKVMSRLVPSQFSVMDYLVVKDGRWIVDKKRFFDMLKLSNVQFLVYSPQGDLREILALEKKNKEAVIDNFNFKLVYKSGPYFIYRIKEKNEVK